MRTIEFRIKRGNRDYPINIQVLQSTDDGLSYCGNGRFCRTNAEAKKYMDRFAMGERLLND